MHTTPSTAAARKLLATIPAHRFDRIPQPGDLPLHRLCGLMQHRRSIGFNRIRADLYFAVRNLLRDWQHSFPRRQLQQWIAALLRERERERQHEIDLMELREFGFIPLD